MKIKRLSAGERLSIVRDAKRFGVYFSAKKHHVNPKTVYHWLRRARDGKGFEKSMTTVISIQERKRLIAKALKNPMSTIKDFMKENSINFSHPTVYNILFAADVTLKIPKIIKLRCVKCSSDYDAIHLYVGLSRTLSCPRCGFGLKRERSYKIFILGSLDSHFLIQQKKLSSLSETDVHILKESLKLPHKSSRIYSDLSDADGNVVTHMVGESSKYLVIYLCGKSSKVDEQIDYSATSGRLSCELLCAECVERANKLLAKGESLQPVFSLSKIDRNKKVDDALKMAKYINNVSLICEIFNISRSTFYRHKKMASRNSHL